MLDFDARIDSTLFSSAKGARELYERFSTFMDRFYVGRWKRWVFIEPFSEAATIGLGGLILMLALAVPAFRETADDDWLKKSDLAVSFLDRYGNPIGNRGIKHNDSIPLEDFPDNLIKATLATEDRRFYDHFGIDIAGTARALMTNAQAGGVRQGGSSITQQLAKNLFLNNERTIERKVKEAFLAIWLETRLTKNEILKLYLDRAYMGGGTFGVDGAAHFYFNKSARDVNLAEAAMLAGLFKAPTKYAPHINLPAARARANVVLDNLVDAGFMTEGQVFGARRNPATAVDRRDENSPNYYLDWAFDEMRKLVDTFPKSYVERVFVVRTTIDMNVQRSAEEAIENRPRQDRGGGAPLRHQGAAARYAVAADRRRRSHRARARRGLCDIPQQGQIGHAAFGAGSPHRHRRSGLALRSRWQEAGAGYTGFGRLRHGGHDEPRCQRRHRAPRGARRYPDRRQDRHHQRISRCVVRRIYREFHLRRLVRQ